MYNYGNYLCLVKRFLINKVTTFNRGGWSIFYLNLLPLSTKKDDIEDGQNNAKLRDVIHRRPLRKHS